MRIGFACCSGAACLAFTLACGTNPKAPADAGDAQPELDAGTDVEVGDAADAGYGPCRYRTADTTCNDLPASATISLGCMNVPSPIGGTIVDGLYELSAATWAQGAFDGGTCPAGAVRRDTIEVCGGALLWLDEDPTDTEYRAALSIDASGSALTLTQSCPASVAQTYAYTATPTSLTIYALLNSSTPVIMLELSRQP